MRIILLGCLLACVTRAALPGTALTPHDEVMAVIRAADIDRVLPTGSMRPTFDERYNLLTLRVPFANLRVGDVIIFVMPVPVRYGGRAYATCCHRIWQRTKPSGWCITKGDHNDTIDDGLVTEADYITMVVGCVLRPQAVLNR